MRISDALSLFSHCDEAPFVIIVNPPPSRILFTTTAMFSGMSAEEFANPFDFQPTKMNPSAGARAAAMGMDNAILGDYYRRVMKKNVFPKTELDAEDDMKTEEEKAEEAGKEFVTKPDALMPEDPRPDPLDNFILANSTLPSVEEERDLTDPFGSRMGTAYPEFPTMKPFKIKQLKANKKNGQIRHSLKVSKPKRKDLSSLSHTGPVKKARKPSSKPSSRKRKTVS